MSSFKLNYAQQVLSVDKKIIVYRTKKFVHSTYGINHVGINGYVFANGQWKQTMLAANSNVRQLYVTDLLMDDRLVVITKNEHGIQFYQQNENELQLWQNTRDFIDNQFEDYFGWNEMGSILLFGRFYANKSLLGVLTHRRKHGTRLYGIMADQIQKLKYPFKILDTNVEIFGNDPTAKFALSDLKQSGQEDIIVHSTNGLSVYRLNEQMWLESVLQVPNSGKLKDSEEEIFFPKLTGQMYRDIILLNATGLFVYQYSSSLSNYELLDFLPTFSKLNGWKKQHTETIQFEDINLDSRDDMLFTGPQGIQCLSFDNKINYWYSLLDNNPLTASQSHSTLIQVLSSNPPIRTQPNIFVMHKDSLQWATIVKEEVEDPLVDEIETPTVPQISSPPPILPSMLSKKQRTDSSSGTLLLRDQLDYSSIYQTMDNIGRPKFTLPLVDLSHLSSILMFNINYDGSSNDDSSGLLGVGWSTPLSLISLLDQPNNFVEDDIYYLIYQNVPQRLTLISRDRNNNIDSFKLPSNQETDLKIDYYKNEERWEVQGKGGRQVYGRAKNEGNTKNGSIGWALRDKNDKNSQRFVNVWYLIEEVVKGNHLHYTYDRYDDSAPGGTFTTAIYLKSVIDEQNNQITFSYVVWESQHYESLTCLDSYTVNTSSYQQIIDFVYNRENGKNILAEIVQRNDITNRPVMKFSYQKLYEVNLMNKVTAPTGVTVQFDYQIQPTVEANIGEVVKINDVEMHHRVDFVDSFVVLSFINAKGYVALRIFNSNLSKELYSSLWIEGSSKLPLFGRGNANFFGILSTERFLAMSISYEKDYELCLLRRAENGWSTEPTCYTFEEETSVRPGKDFIVTDKDSSIQIIRWSEDTNSWIWDSPFKNLKFDLKSSTFAVCGRIIMLYDGVTAWIAYQNLENQWVYNEVTKIDGIMNDIKSVINKFALDDATRLNLFTSLRQQVLHLSTNNVFLLSRWQIDGMKLYTVIDMFLLNGNYDVVKHRTFKIPQDDLTQFSKEIENNETYIRFVYQLNDDNMFTPHATSMRGRKSDEIDTAKPNKSAREVIKENELAKISEQMKNFFMLDLRNYLPALNPQNANVRCNGKTFTFTNNDWIEETASKPEQHSIPLGNEFMLFKANSAASLQLYPYADDTDKLKNSIIDLGVTQSNETLIRYPAYLAYQQTNKPVNMIKFGNYGGIDQTFQLPEGEVISPFSNHRTLVTSISSPESKTLDLQFRQQLGVSANTVVAAMTITFDNGGKRITGYEYSDATMLGNTIFYETITTIPNNNKKSFGWYEDTHRVMDPSQSQKKIFNSGGECVRIDKFQETPSADTAKTVPNTDTAIWDKFGKLRIAHTFVNEIANEEIGYYGFEDYEINKIGTSTENWTFDEKDVIDDGFSFTGNNFLRLTTNRLMGIFHPANQLQYYVASCWIRAQNETIALTAIVPYLKIIVSSNDARVRETFIQPAVVQFQSGDWFYLEAILDIIFAKEDLKSTADVGLTEKENLDISLTVSVIVSSRQYVTIDVDHVRFAKLDRPFDINVYDTVTNQLKDVIKFNGLIERRVYNKYHKQVLTINGYGELKEFKTNTTASSIGRLSTMKSQIVIQPEIGFYETFSPVSFRQRWKIDRADSWQASAFQLHHSSDESNTLQLIDYDPHQKSFGIRMCYSLSSSGAFIKFHDDLQAIQKRTGENVIKISGKERLIPPDGELLIIAENERILLWIDGGLYFDSFLTISLYNMEVFGRTTISDLLVFYNPSVAVTYFNSLDEKVQEISLVNESDSIVIHYLYDELGGQTITTVPVLRDTVAYNPNFIVNGDPLAIDSIFKTGKLSGEVTQFVDEYSYTQIKPCKNPMNEVCAIGLPGKEFSIFGHHARHFSSDPKHVDLFIKNLYPIDKNYNYVIQYRSGDIKDISIYDNKNNRVAWYYHIPSGKDLLSTYEYDSNGKLIKSLPPLYHEKVNTFEKTNQELSSVTDDDRQLQQTLGVIKSFDNNGNILTKTTPDATKTEYVYGDNELLKFVIHYSNSNAISDVIYFDYDTIGRLRSTGTVINPISKTNLLTLKFNSNTVQTYQQFQYNNLNRVPTLRRNVGKTFTYNEMEPLVEEYTLNIDDDIVSKRIAFHKENEEKSLLVEISKRYAVGKLKEIRYPFELNSRQLSLVYKYDKLGQMVGIGVPGNEQLFASYTYNSNRVINSETHLPGSASSFVRKYVYNSAGFLINLTDKFLTETIDYTENGYGNDGFNDGKITRTKYHATWHEYSNYVGLNEHSFVNSNFSPQQSQVCFQKLKEAGYVDDDGRQQRIFYTDLEAAFPFYCRDGSAGRHIQLKLGEYGFPSTYGHSYDYDNYQALSKAKYFIENDTPKPFNSFSFSLEIPGLSKTASQDIFDRLQKSKYLLQDNDKSDTYSGHDRRSKSLIRSTFKTEFTGTIPYFAIFAVDLERLLIQCFYRKLDASVVKLSIENAMVVWNTAVLEADAAKRQAQQIIQMLDASGYLINPLETELTDTLQPYESYIHDIVRIMSTHFAHGLGKAEFDAESYGSDTNGNHLYFYTGFDRFEIQYRVNSNQISQVKLESLDASTKPQSFAMKHDNRGNVIEALHNRIQRIDYHVVSNRATRVELTDGTVVAFHYDAKGERILKRVSDRAGNITKEVYYIRDEFGRSLVERQVTYYADHLHPDVLLTAYIYGPNGLVGFIRRDQFYSVISDHDRSIRLVVKGNEVVAAYDFMPYGNLMRKYESYPDASITYRYNGKEWDEEIGVYNYGTRFYDPSIGRFYQIDPKEQYFSPYKYAGNSPISTVDVNGEFAFTIITVLVCAAVGAYLSAAAVNERFDFTKWDYSYNSGTLRALLTGGIGGALMPFGFAASVELIGFGGTIASGFGGAYMGMAVQNNNWYPGDLLSPQTWNAAFTGFGTGSGIVGSISGGINTYRNLESVWSRRFFIAGSAGAGVLSFGINSNENDWDFSKPGIYFHILQAVDSGSTLGVFGRKFLKSSRISFNRIISGSTTVLGKTALKSMGFMVASYIFVQFDNSEFDLKSPNTYFDMLNAVIMIHGFHSTGKKAIEMKQYETNMIEHGEVIRKTLHEIAEKAAEKEKEINNAHGAVAAAMGGNYAVVGFSGLKDKATIYLFVNTNGEFHIKEQIELKKNSEIRYNDGNGEKVVKIVLNPDTTNNNAIIQSIETLKRATADHNGVIVKDYMEDVNSKFHQLETTFGRDKTERIRKDILEHVSTHAWLDAALIIKKITEVDISNIKEQLENKKNDWKKTKARIKKKEDALKSYEKTRQTIEDNSTGPNIDKQTNKQLKQIFNNEYNEIIELHLTNPELVKRIEGKISELERDIAQDRTDLNIKHEEWKKLEEALKSDEESAQKRAEPIVEDFWPDIEYRIMSYPQWVPQNCAEPHAITAFGVFNSQHDLEYLGTYKFSDLTDFPACRHCQVTTKYVKNVVTEPTWTAVDKKRLAVYHKAILHGANNLPNFLGRTVNRTKNHSGVIRQRRSTLYTKNMLDYKINTHFGTRMLNKTISFVNGLTKFWLNDNTTKSEPESRDQMSQWGEFVVDTNGTILLLNMLVRKVTGQRFVPAHGKVIPEQIATGYAINITHDFKKLIKKIAKDNELHVKLVDFDFSKLQGEIAKKISSCEGDEILRHLKWQAQKILFNKTDGHRRTQRIDEIMRYIDDKLSIMLEKLK